LLVFGAEKGIQYVEDFFTSLKNSFVILDMKKSNVANSHSVSAVNLGNNKTS